MKQLTQKLKSGELSIHELPWPQVGPGMILVRNHYSLISTGTEGSTVKMARASLIAKAKERPQQVKQVLEVLRRQGLMQTYRAVMKKLDAYSPLGYSSAGVVIEVGGGVRGFAVSDKVACAGAGYANHAEIVAVPENLCVKLHDKANLKLASYNTMGAIALQGIRQANLRLGENCAVIGLGLLGQLTCLMLRASGVRVVGVDIDAIAVATANEHCADLALTRSTPGIADTIAQFSSALGVDAVIITAGSSSLDPVNFAGQIVRKKGSVVIVGAVPTGFERDPYYYKKELELKMSCSYGPGRYDLNYEEKGFDYPVGYVRWTENRNMLAFQDLIRSHKIDVSYLTTHEFRLEDAAQAYDMVVNRSEPYLGIVLKYDVEKEIYRKPIAIASVIKAESKVGIAFIGAGSYAQGNLLPNIPKNDSEVICRSVITNSGTTSKRVAEKYSFETCTSEVSHLFADANVNTVFIATRHDSHADYVLQALKARKHVFVEKPICLTMDELIEIESVYDKSVHLMVGFNRRFAPLAADLKKRIGDGPVSMLYRVNAGYIPADTWIQDMSIGGGRIVGEACHFIDFMTYFALSKPVRVYASVLPDPEGLCDTVNINVQYQNGSIGTLSYFANGSKSLSKEYFEVYSSGVTGIINDFKELIVYGADKSYRKKLINQDKGQSDMVHRFIESIRTGGDLLIPASELFAVAKACFAALESIKSKCSVEIL